MHYKISKLLDENPAGEDWEELRIVCDNEREFNDTLNALYHYGDGKLKMSGVSYNPMEIVVEKDPRLSYRQFDESSLSGGESSNETNS